MIFKTGAISLKREKREWTHWVQRQARSRRSEYIAAPAPGKIPNLPRRPEHLAKHWRLKRSVWSMAAAALA